MNISRTPNFIAKYEYGASEEQIKREPNDVWSFFRKIALWLTCWMAFSGASSIKKHSVTGLSKQRVKTAKQQLEGIGGESLKLQTPDGDILEAMYLDAEEFKKKIFSCFQLEHIIESESEKKYLFKLKTTSKDDKKTELFCKQLQQLGFNVYGQEMSIALPHIVADSSLNSSENSQPTVLIAGGSGAVYTFYKTLATTYLLCGLNVMFLNYRGYGESSGDPSGYKLKMDVETAYQYLKQKKGVDNKKLLLHGHCLGSGAITDLAARRPGVNVLLDRPFSEPAEIAGNAFPFIRPVLRKVVPSIVQLKNTENLSKISGHIAIEVDTQDKSIMTKEELKCRKISRTPKLTPISKQTLDLIHHLPKNRKGQVIKLLDSDVGHTKAWHKEPVTRLQLFTFLKEANLLRKVF